MNKNLHNPLWDASEKEKLEKIREDKRKWLKWLAVFAAFLLIVLLFAQRFLPSKNNTGLPSLLLDNHVYYISSHQAQNDTLPNGFEFQGEIDVAGLKECPYFMNPENPYWVFVYHRLHEDGTIDDSANSDTQKVFVRYVDSRLRDRDMVNYDGKLYISMWSAQCTGEFPDVSAETYSMVNKNYGMRIEGNPFEGFAHQGETTFCGYDRIPCQNMESNFAPAQIWVDPDNSQVILVSTQWVTAEQGKQVIHNGYNVYICYEGTLI